MNEKYNQALLEICSIIKNQDISVKTGLKMLDEAKNLLLCQSTSFGEKTTEDVEE